MPDTPFALEPLAEHDRSGFSSGAEPLDRYFQTQVTQDIRRRITNCFVAVERETGIIAGFYTLAAASIALSDLPESVTKKLPRYPTIPAVRMGRLAVDLRFKGRGLGGALLADAVVRASRAEAAAFAMLVDAKDDIAAKFYEHHGFQRFASQPMTLFLALGSPKRSPAPRPSKAK